MDAYKFDPHTGMSRYWNYESESGDLKIHVSQDVEESLEYAKRLRQNAEYTKTGMKERWLHAAHIPMGIVHDLLIKGVDVFSDPKEALRIIERDYPHFKTTEMKNLAATKHY